MELSMNVQVAFRLLSKFSNNNNKIKIKKPLETRMETISRPLPSSKGRNSSSRGHREALAKCLLFASLSRRSK